MTEGRRCTGQPRAGTKAVVRLLLEKGADVDAKTNDGGTAPTLGGRDYLTYTFD